MYVAAYDLRTENSFFDRPEMKNQRYLRIYGRILSTVDGLGAYVTQASPSAIDVLVHKVCISMHAYIHTFLTHIVLDNEGSPECAFRGHRQPSRRVRSFYVE